MTKYIFLDKDGVLNHQKFYSERYKHPYDTWNMYHENNVCKYSLELLNNLISKTGAKVVLSASMRFDHDIAGLNNYFKDLGFEGEIVDRTPFIDITKRGYEIETWLENKGFTFAYWSKNRTESYMRESGVSNYLILDDDADMLYTQRNHFVHISQYKHKSGFNKHYYNKALRILEKDILSLNF